MATPSVWAGALMACLAAFGTHAQWTNASQDLLPLAATNGRTTAVASADFDGDGHLDLVIATELGQNAIFFWRDGRFEYSVDALPQGTRRDSQDIAIGDFDQDGDIDLLFVSRDDQTNELYLNDGNGLFTLDQLPREGAGGFSNAVVMGDVDGDGDLDLIIGNTGPRTAPGMPNATGGQNILLLNDGEGFFEYAPGALPLLEDRTQDLVLADIDGDGDLDLIVANEGANRILINDGTGVFTDETEERLGERPNEETRAVAVADLDGDGHLDMYFANVAWSGASPRDALLLNDGGGVFRDASDRLPARDIFSLDVVLADVDGDGDIDIVLAQIDLPAGSAVGLLINDGESFTDGTRSLPVDATGSGVAVDVADYNGDGEPDIYIGNHQSFDLLLAG